MKEYEDTNPLCIRFENAQVRIFLNNGKVLTGKANFIKNLIYVKEEHGQDALVNMSYVVAISRHTRNK